MKRIELPSADYLRTKFIYEQETGKLVWANGFRKGKEAGYPKESQSRVSEGKRIVTSYIYVKLQDKNLPDYKTGKKVYAHRIIWKMMTGEDLGKMSVDHVNGDGTDNRWKNLRKATFSQNAANREVTCRSKSGIKGVKRMETLYGVYRYRADIRKDGKSISLGTYDTLDEAIAARARAENRLYKEFANPSVKAEYKLKD